MKKIREFLGQTTLLVGVGVFMMAVAVVSVIVFIGNMIYFKSISIGFQEAKNVFNHFLNEVL